MCLNRLVGGTFPSLPPSLSSFFLFFLPSFHPSFLPFTVVAVVILLISRAFYSIKEGLPVPKATTMSGVFLISHHRWDRTPG